VGTWFVTTSLLFGNKRTGLGVPGQGWVDTAGVDPDSTASFSPFTVLFGVSGRSLGNSASCAPLAVGE